MSDPILEGLVTTRNADGSLHLAPMGPRIAPGWKRILLRPFPTSHTYRNLCRHGQGVLHVTDDVGLLARAAVGQAGIPNHRPAERIDGYILSDACRFYEFVVRQQDTRGERVQIDAEIVHAATLRDFFGFNRAKHAVVEAAILMTRLHLIAAAEIETEMKRLRVLVEKTGADAEQQAFAFLEAYLDRHRHDRESGA